MLKLPHYNRLCIAGVRERGFRCGIPVREGEASPYCHVHASLFNADGTPKEPVAAEA